MRITSVMPSDDGRLGAHFTSVHAMSRAAVGLIPDEGELCRPHGLSNVVLPAESATLHGRVGRCGPPEAYLAANLAVLDGEVNTPIDPWTRCAPRRQLDREALRLRSSPFVIGRCTGARGRSPHRLRGLDGVRTEGSFERAVIYDDGAPCLGCSSASVRSRPRSGWP